LSPPRGKGGAGRAYAALAALIRHPEQETAMAHLPGLAFDLGETITMLRDSVQQFADDEIAPRAADIDRDILFPADLWEKLGALGLHGVSGLEKYSWSGIGY